MKAYIQRKYGGPETLKLEERPIDDPPQGHVQVEVKALSVNPLNWHLMRATPFFVRFSRGLFAPKQQIQEGDFSGAVTKVGPGVDGYKVGDEVYGEGSSVFAQLANVSVNVIAKKPARLSHDQAAAIPVAALTALQGLRDHGKLQKGQSVLLNGASGGVGTFAVQIAKSMGAHVTAVCSHRNIDLVKSLGADRVIDYTVDDFTSMGEEYDVVVDIAGSRKVKDSLKALKEGGTLVLIGMTSFSLLVGSLMRGPALAKKQGKHFANFTAEPKTSDLEHLAQLAQSGAINPAIDKSYSFENLPQAIEYIETMRAKAKVVVQVS